VNRFKVLVLTLFIIGVFTRDAVATPQSLRWTGQEDRNAELTHILEVIRVKSGIELSITDLVPVEDRALATSQYTMLAQAVAGVPVAGQSIRIWKSLANGDAIQVEARIDKPTHAVAPAVHRMRQAFTSQDTMALVRKAVERRSDDPYVRSIDWNDVWEDGKLVRRVRVKGKHGIHRLTVSLAQRQIIAQTYEEFPQADQAGETSVPVQIYPIYEMVEGVTPVTVLPRIDSELRYLKTLVRRPVEDPYASLRLVHYQDDMWDPLLGLTVAGRKEGYWAMAYIKARAAELLAATPTSENSFSNGGLILDGRYVTVSLNPDIATTFKPLSFTPGLSGQFYPTYRVMADKPDHEEMVPMASLLGRPITSYDDAYNRLARILPDNDPVTYINDGFDELQVYWSVTQLFDSLHSMGFTDPDLSTRPFHAFLFNPDISYRDNAFYTDDTINFTTYSPGSANMARDNSTIWHELGHGVMDRLMGDQIQLADTGGLSEGMADFVAQLVINDVTGGTPFPGKELLRIFNNMGFHLTNEVHDDGEAYGGAMNDLLRAAMSRYGRPGLAKVTDLTLETMRLTRNHPGLTASDWFEHMVFADSLGNSPVRQGGELQALILKALNGRNFTFGNAENAKFTLKNGNDEVTSKGPGSRDNPIQLKLKADETASYTLNASVQDSATYAFKFPVTVRVDFKQGALQGAIHWEGEENNPLTFTLNSASESVSIPLKAYGKCQEINRPDGSCVDYAYVQIWNQGETHKPQAKKRFYLRIHPQN
jgi:hypothetical protein